MLKKCLQMFASLLKEAVYLYLHNPTDWICLVYIWSLLFFTLILMTSFSNSISPSLFPIHSLHLFSTLFLQSIILYNSIFHFQFLSHISLYKKLKAVVQRIVVRLRACSKGRGLGIKPGVKSRPNVGLSELQHSWQIGSRFIKKKSYS